MAKTQKVPVSFVLAHYAMVSAKKLDQLDSVAKLKVLKVPPGNRLEDLPGHKKKNFFCQ